MCEDVVIRTIHMPTSSPENDAIFLPLSLKKGVAIRLEIPYYPNTPNTAMDGGIDEDRNRPDHRSPSLF